MSMLNEAEGKKLNDLLKKMETLENKMAYLEYVYHSTLKAKIKNFFRPRLGKLHQYHSRPFPIFKKYTKPIPLTATPPLISIVTPTRNQGDFLERTILSIIRQNYPNLEYIIQDGASTDHTLDVIKRYQSFLKHWESIEDTGQSNAINRGFCHSTGEIMAYLNSDDILLPGSLHYIANYFQNHPEVDVVYGHRIIINEKDLEVGRWVLPPHNSETLTWADYIPQETLFWRRRIWDKVGQQVDESYQFAMDWDLLIRFLNAGAKFVRLPRFIGAFRVHTSQKTSIEIGGVGEKEMEKIRLRCHGRYVSYQEISKKIRPYLIKHVIYNKLSRIGLLRY